VLNDKFSSLAVEITLERKKFIDSINKNLDDIYREISDYCGLNLKYNNSVDLIEDISQMKKMFIDKLNSSYEREKIYGMTLVGPHRDDYSLFLNEKNLAIYGSQGQNRLAVLALKLSEISIFKVITGDYPILLLDDVFSELDIQKRNKLIKYILDDVQTIITTTDLEIIDDILLKKSKIFKIVDGKVV
jgi:DNA replication and repair protein RecF